MLRRHEPTHVEAAQVVGGATLSSRRMFAGRMSLCLVTIEWRNARRVHVQHMHNTARAKAASPMRRPSRLPPGTSSCTKARTSMDVPTSVTRPNQTRVPLPVDGFHHTSKPCHLTLELSYSFPVTRWTHMHVTSSMKCNKNRTDAAHSGGYAGVDQGSGSGGGWASPRLTCWRSRGHGARWP